MVLQCLIQASASVSVSIRGCRYGCAFCLALSPPSDFGSSRLTLSGNRAAMPCMSFTVTLFRCAPSSLGAILSHEVFGDSLRSRSRGSPPWPGRKQGPTLAGYSLAEEHQDCCGSRGCPSCGRWYWRHAWLRSVGRTRSRKVGLDASVVLTHGGGCRSKWAEESHCASVL